MTAATARIAGVRTVRRRRIRPRRLALYAFLSFMAVTWLFPLAWAVYTALRPYADTAQRGYISLPGTLDVNNFVNAWNQANFPQFYLNSLIVAIPSVILVLFLASMVAFAVTRFSWRFNLLCLMLFTQFRFERAEL